MHAPRPYAPGGLDVSAADGGTGASTAAAARTNLGIDPLSALQSNLSATTAPTANDDSDDGYSVGSTWINVTTDEAYVCLDATVGAAVWENTTTTGSGAPVDASYVTMGLNGTLTAERVLTGTVNQVVVTDDYPGAYTVTLSLAYGIDATRIGGGGVTSTVFGHLGDVTSYVQAQLDAKQPLDADLTAVSGLGATAGMLARTAVDAFAVRTLTGTANQVTISDGDGAAANPTFSLPQSIATASSPTFTGLTLSGLTAARLAATGALSVMASVANLTAWVAGTANQVAVADDGDGTITLSLASGIDATKIGGGGVTSTVFGHLGDVTSYVQAQLDAKQPLDADLTAISGLGATAGMLARTATDTFAVRTIAGTANEITFTNGDGAAGAPTAKVERDLEIVCIDYTTDCAVGDGKGYITVPKATGSKDLAFVHMAVITAGTTGSMTVQIHNETDNVDMLSSPITLDSGVKTSITAAIDNTKDDVVYGDVLRIDVDAVHTTPAKGLIVTMHFA